MKGSEKKVGLASCLGAAAGGGALGGAMLGAAESAWLVAHAGERMSPGVAGYGILLYGGAGLLLGLALGLTMGVVRLALGRSDGTRSGIYTVAAGLVVVFVGFPAAKFLVGRDVFMEKLAWFSLAGIGVQAAILAGTLAIFFALITGLRRALDRLPSAFTGPVLTPVALAVLSGGLYALDILGKPVEEVQAKRRVPGGPNIVLVMVDTLRADVTDHHGGPGLTPNLARLVRSGVSFMNAHANSSWTRPSVATVLSGRYPSSHGAMYKMEGLPDEVDTIAEQLRAVGYRTHGIVSNYVTAPYFNFGQGFDEYVYLEPSYLLGANEVTSKFNLYEMLRVLHSRFLPGAVKPNAQYREGSHVTAEALRWLESWRSKAKASDRYFLFVQYMDPHDPYFGHPDTGGAPSRKAMPDPPDFMRDRMWKLYQGEVAYWDSQFGVLLTGLMKHSSWKETLVLVFSDHGEEFLEHDGWWHGDTLYEEAIHVPLVVRLPGDEAAGRKVEDLVGLVDVAPTLVRLGGARIPPGFQGRDLFETGSSPVFAEEQHLGNELKALIYKKPGAGHWKVISCNEANPRGLELLSLFDLTADRGEKKNLAGELGPELDLALAALAVAARSAAEGAVKKKAVEIDEAAKSRLKELGYIQDDKD